MFNYDFLLQLSSNTSASIDELQSMLPVPTKITNPDHFRAAAKACAVWMQRNGIRELSSVGPFVSFMPQVDQQVVIKSGSFVRATKVAKSTQILRKKSVRVHDVRDGFVDGTEVHHAEVVWVAFGGYWCRTPLYNIIPKV